MRRHAREDAWILAKRYVGERQHDWEESRGANASEAFVAREVCVLLAQELIRSHHVSSDSTFDHTRCYGDVAAQIAGILARDFSEHAFPRARV